MKWKAYQCIIWVTISVTVLAYAFDGFPVPRPPYLFASSGICLGILMAQLRGADRRPSPGESMLFMLAVIAVAFLLRWSMWVRIILTSGDALLDFGQRMAHIIENGHIIRSGMYSRNPVYHLVYAFGVRATGSEIFEARFIAVVVSSLFPLLMYPLGKTLGDRRTGLLASVVTVPFPLVLRTGSILESESIVLPLFILVLYLYLNPERTRAHQACLLVLLGALSLVHAMYPLIIIGIMLASHTSSELMAAVRSGREGNELIAAIIAGAMFSFYLVISAELGRLRLIGFMTEGSSFELPSSPLFFIPTSGDVASSVTGGNSLLETALNYVPILLFLLLATIGGLYAVYQARTQDVYRQLIGFTAILGISTVVLTLVFRSSSSMRIGFRIYYFSGTVGIIYTTIAVTEFPRHLPSLNLPTRFDLQRMYTVGIMVILFTYFVLSPMSTIGNNADPAFGGRSERFTLTNEAQLQQIESILSGDEKPIYPPEKSTLYWLFKSQYLDDPYFAPTTDTPERYKLRHETDCHDSQIWDSGGFRLCYIH